MRWGLVLLMPLVAQAADDAAARGAAIFRQTCAVVYCHGPEGRAGRAPALAGRRFDAAAVMGIVATGIPNTSMPGFARQMKAADLAAVAAYVVSLNGDSEGARPAAAETLPPEVERGRSLFFDAARTGACGACHEIGGRGTPVSVALADPRSVKAGDLQAVETPNVVTARPAGEDAFPALVVEKGGARTRVYDLSSRLPVLRTFASSRVELTAGSPWSHRTTTELYTAAELEAIAGYLRWLAAR